MTIANPPRNFEMDDESYRIGKHVGHVMGSLMAGSRGISATWSPEAPEQAKRDIEDMAKFRGLSCKFGERTIDVFEPEKKRPDLKLVQ